MFSFGFQLLASGFTLEEFNGPSEGVLNAAIASLPNIASRAPLIRDRTTRRPTICDRVLILAVSRICLRQPKIMGKQPNRQLESRFSGKAFPRCCGDPYLESLENVASPTRGVE